MGNIAVEPGSIPGLFLLYIESISLRLLLVYVGIPIFKIFITFGRSCTFKSPYLLRF